MIADKLIVKEIIYSLPCILSNISIFSDRDLLGLRGNLCLRLQELVIDVAVAALSCAHCLADARPSFIGRRSLSTVLSQVCVTGR